MMKCVVVVCNFSEVEGRRSDGEHRAAHDALLPEQAEQERLEHDALLTEGGGWWKVAGGQWAPPIRFNVWA